MSQSTFQIFIWMMLAVCVVGCKNPLADDQSGSKIDDTYHPGATAADPILQNFILNIPFTAGTESSYVISDASRVELADGVVRLKKADQTDDVANTLPTTGGFMNGTLTGVQWDSTNNYVRLNTSTNTAELDASWTPQWSSLVGYWKMDNTWSDALGLNNGTATNGASFTAVSKIGSHSGIFDGVNDYTSLGTMGTFGSSMGPGFSIALWVKTSTTGTGRAIIGTSNGAAGRGSFSIRLNVKGDNSTAMIGAIRIGFGSDDASIKYLTSAVEVNTGINDGNWHHLAVVVTPLSNTVVVSLDGQLQPITYQAQGSPTVFSDFTYPVVVGGLNSTGTPTAFISAQLDDLAIWSTALSFSQIQTIYERQSAKYSGQLISRVLDAYSSQSWTTLASTTTLPFYKELPGSSGSESSTNYSSLIGSTGSTSDNNLMSNLAAYWPMNNDWTDHSSAAHNTGTASGAGATFSSTEKLFGSHAGAFDAVSGVAYPNAIPFSNGDFSISTWVYIKGPGGGSEVPPSNTIFCQRVDSIGTGQPAVAMQINSTNFPNLQIRDNVGVGITATSSVAIKLNTWNHIVAIKTATQMKVYVNGVLTNTTNHTLTGSVSAGVTNKFFGKHRFGGADYDFLNGNLDEVAVWTRALNATEIKQLYRRGANRLKYQVRSCSASDCSDQDVLTTTYQGWKGPDNTGLSYFSELYNTTNNVLAGTVSTSSPMMTFSNFSGTGLSVSANRYFQYRAILESDDQNTLCNYGSGAVACSPELQAVVIGPNHYDTTIQSIISKSTIGSAYQTLDTNGMTETLGGNSCSSDAKYSLSSDGTTFYYWNGSAWATSIAYATANDAATMRTNISSFPSSAARTGTLQIKTYLKSSGTSACEVDNLQFTGRKY